MRVRFPGFCRLTFCPQFGAEDNLRFLLRPETLSLRSLLALPASLPSPRRGGVVSLSLLSTNRTPSPSKDAGDARSIFRFLGRRYRSTHSKKFSCRPRSRSLARCVRCGRIRSAKSVRTKTPPALQSRGAWLMMVRTSFIVWSALQYRLLSQGLLEHRSPS